MKYYYAGLKKKVFSSWRAAWAILAQRIIKKKASSASSISESIFSLAMKSYYIVIQLLECSEKLINVHSQKKIISQIEINWYLINHINRVTICHQYT